MLKDVSELADYLCSFGGSEEVPGGWRGRGKGGRE